MFCFLLAVASVLSLIVASPAKVINPQVSSTTIITGNSQLQTIISGLEKDFDQGTQIASAFREVLDDIVPANAPASIPQALSKVQSAYAAHPTDFFAQAAALVLESVVEPDVDNIITGYSLKNNQNNINLKSPLSPVYPKKDPSDAPYDLPEAELRSKIFIPLGFTYGKKQPVILVPGTALEAGENFASNCN
jgi:hypothetical protein